MIKSPKNTFLTLFFIARCQLCNFAKKNINKNIPEKKSKNLTSFSAPLLDGVVAVAVVGIADRDEVAAVVAAVVVDPLPADLVPLVGEGGTGRFPGKEGFYETLKEGDTIDVDYQVRSLGRGDHTWAWGVGVGGY